MSFTEFISYGFVQRALISGVLVALITALLGVFLVLKRLSLLGDSLSHIALSGVAVGLLLNVTPVFCALPIVMLSSLGVFKLSKNNKIHADSALGIVSSAGIALGLVAAAIAGGFNTDLMGFLFGNILTISTSETVLSIVVFLIVIACLYFFYNALIATVFDENFAKTAGVKVDKINTLLVLLSAVVVVLAVKTVGIMLVSALIIIPPISAIQIAKKFKSVLIYSGAFSVFATVGGVYLSFIFNLPPSALIIILNLIILCICGLIKYGKSRKIN
ncbi:MAG: metal ABC transporter permease [Elusimicrobiaceae bacterium]|nr:metal ABC transporter permease [Elusimicrobiaceae bacterium]